MLPLVQLNQEEIERIVAGVPGGVGNVQDVYGLAPLQEGILFQHLMGRERDPYVQPVLRSFESRAGLEGYLEALQAVINRHDILRTAIVWEGLSEPVQVVWRRAPLVVEEVRVEGGGGEVRGQMRASAEQGGYRMDLSQAPMMRGFRAEDVVGGQWLLLMWWHHLAIDHATLEVMHEEIEAHMLGRTEGLGKPQPFRNFVAQARLGVSREEHQAFFRQLLGDVEEPTAPFGLLDTQGDGSGIRGVRRKVESGLARRLHQRARKLGVSTASLFHVAWAQVLARVSGRQDVVFGTVLFGRMQGGEGTERGLGLFINTLPVRVVLGREGAEESVRGMHDQLGKLLRHEHASLTLAQRCSGVAAPLPLFSALLNYRYSQATARSREGRRAWEGSKVLYSEDRTSYPCVLAVDDLGEDFVLTVQMAEPIEPERVCEMMQRVLEGLVEALEKMPARTLSSVDVLGAEERRRILEEWNDTGREVAETTLAEMFEAQVERSPEAVAVVFEGRELKYRELNERANRLAHYLMGRGVGPEEIVGICLERSLEMVVALLGVLKAGGAYLPLDPEYPEERLKFMVEDAAPICVVTSGRAVSRLPHGYGAVMLEERQTEEALSESKTSNTRDVDRSRPLRRGNPMYVIYTSGSTGIPKGTVVEHGAASAFLHAMTDVLSLRPGDRHIAITTVAFDISIVELLLPLCYGAGVVVAGEDEVHDPRKLATLMQAHQASCIQATPSFWGQLTEGEFDFLRGTRILVGGEALGSGLAGKLYGIGGKVLNLYGPTEATVWASAHRLKEGDVARGSTGIVSIGRP